MIKQNRALQTAIIVTLVLRLMTSPILYAATKSISVEACPVFPCYEQVNQQLNSTWFGKYFLAPWYRWDTVHYLDKADPDYEVLGLTSTVWPPMYSWLIRLFSLVMPGMAAALLISTLVCGATFYLLYDEVAARWDDQLALRTVLLLAFFPSGFFLMAGYTEALFLALSLAVFACIRKQKYGLAGLWGALAVLTRLPGVFLALPLAWEGLVHIRVFLRGRKVSALWPAILRERQLLQMAVAVLMIALTLGVYFSFLHFVQQAPSPWQSRSEIWGHHLSWPGFGVINNVRFLLSHHYQLFPFGLLFDALLLVVMLAVLIVQWKKLPAGWVIYALVMLIFPTLFLSGEGLTMSSISRYALVVFPAFAALAGVLRIRAVRSLWLAFSICSFTMLLFLFTRWFWVA